MTRPGARATARWAWDATLPPCRTINGQPAPEPFDLTDGWICPKFSGELEFAQYLLQFEEQQALCDLAAAALICPLEMRDGLRRRRAPP